ncbi:hypothetical protein AK966_06280 [Vibrio sp. PID23_8]|nr:hypothetical protein AK965_06980 [Vibrio sp. PID17_43]RIZ54961.1 hypothetical protein AK966_06280 [Vibrio sp. PID23_8]
MIFAYKKGNSSLGESSDGTILLSSQLRLQAQEQAEKIYVINHSYMSDLHNADVFEAMERFWIERVIII